jgi:hypothetical protein
VSRVESEKERQRDKHLDADTPHLLVSDVSPTSIRRPSTSACMRVCAFQQLKQKQEGKCAWLRVSVCRCCRLAACVCVFKNADTLMQMTDTREREKERERKKEREREREKEREQRETCRGFRELLENVILGHLERCQLGPTPVFTSLITYTHYRASLTLDLSFSLSPPPLLSFSHSLTLSLSLSLSLSQHTTT